MNGGFLTFSDPDRCYSERIPSYSRKTITQISSESSVMAQRPGHRKKRLEFIAPPTAQVPGSGARLLVLIRANYPASVPNQTWGCRAGCRGSRLETTIRQQLEEPSGLTNIGLLYSRPGLSPPLKGVSQSNNPARPCCQEYGSILPNLNESNSFWLQKYLLAPQHRSRRR